MPFLHSSLNERNDTRSHLIDEPLMNTLPLAMIAWSKRKIMFYRFLSQEMFCSSAFLHIVFFFREQALFFKILISWSSLICPNNFFYCIHAKNPPPHFAFPGYFPAFIWKPNAWKQTQNILAENQNISYWISGFFSSYWYVEDWAFGFEMKNELFLVERR